MNGSLEIGKAALTITADDKTKTYDGSAFTAFTSTYSGFVNGEDASALSGTLTYTGTAATSINAGTYTITPQGVTSDNYEITFADGSLEIGKAALTVTADSKAKTYDGSAFTAFTSTFSGLVNGEDETALTGTLTYTGTAATAVNAGTYTITPQGVTSDNYEITFVNGSLEIGKAALTVTAENKTKTYDGSAFTTFTSTFSGLVNGEDASALSGTLAYTGDAATATNAGTYTITPQGVTSDNYEISFVNGSLEIGKAALTVTADDKAKTYDGSAFTTFTSTFSGFVNGEDATVLGGALTYTGDAATATNAGTYTITPQGVTSDNYEITFADGSLEIGKATLTVTADDKAKTYDGSAFTTFTSTFSGLVNGEDASALSGTLAYTGAATTATNAGTYTITPQGVTSDNYEISFVNGSLEIGKAALTVTADDKAKTYDGSAFTTFTSTFSGLVNGEDETALTGTLTYTGTAATAVNAGTYTITPQGVTSSNYEITFVNGSLEIGKAALTVTADDKAKTYDGSAFTTFTSTFSGFVNSEDASALSGTLAYTGAATTATNAGTYTITPQGVTSDNYEISFVNGSLEIGKAALTVTADDKAKTYDGSAFTAFTSTYSGFVNSEDATVLGGALTYTGAATTATNAGTYTITPQGFTSDNYEITFVNGSLEIGKAALIVTADNKTKNEGEENPMFTFTYSGFIGNDTANDIDEQPNVSTTATADSPAGEYPIILVGGVDNNYTFTLVNGTLTVEEIKYAISFTVTSKESPVANAIIQINGMELTTDANGLASINLPNGSYTYTVTASGYVTHEDNITVSDAEKSVSINLSTVGIGTQNISQVQAYPNPFTNNLNIQSDEDIKTVQVMDITGKTACMYSNVNSSNLLIPTDQLRQGIYIIVIQTATHTKTLKVVKQ
ncbi:MBG domain [anaerobic digester metagenome]